MRTYCRRLNPVPADASGEAVPAHRGPHQLIPVSDGEQRQILGMDVTFFDIHSTKAKQFGFTAVLSDGRRLTCCGDEPFHPLCAPYVENSAWLLHEAFCLYEDRDRFKTV